MTLPFSGMYWVSIKLFKKRKNLLDTFCGLVHVFCAVYHTYVLYAPFIELPLASDIWLVQVFIDLLASFAVKREKEFYTG